MNSRRPTEDRVRQIGREILDSAMAHQPHLFQQDWWVQRMMAWSMNDDRLRARLFHFIDVLPSLATSDQIVEHLREYMLGEDQAPLPPALERSLRVGLMNAATRRATAIAIRANIRAMARHFIAGESIAEATRTAERLRRRSMTFTMDILGEETTADDQAEGYARRYLELIDALADAADRWRPDPRLDEDPRGPLPKASVSVKLSALDPRFDPIDPERVARITGDRLRSILRRARQRGVAITIDMERYEFKDLTLRLFKSLLAEDEFADASHFGIALQAYLEDTERDLLDLLDWTRRRGAPIGVRLVKGAYWDYEVAHAAEQRWPAPVWPEKWQTDECFERLAAVLMENHTWLRPAIASHNARSLAAALAEAERHGLDPRDYEIQMLYGMGDALKAAIVERGLRLRVYTPFGPLIPGMAYLIRRLLENTANTSFLRQSFSEHVAPEVLLSEPRPPHGVFAEPVSASTGEPPPPPEEFPQFVNEPLTDFSIQASREAMSAALCEVRETRCGREYPFIIGGRKVATGEWIESINPASPRFVVGRAARARPTHADQAVAAALAAWPSWRASPVADRARLLRDTARIMRERRFELSAWIVLESAKPWREADADVAEAIDYCEFYAREALRVCGHPRRRDVPGEENALIYLPRGVAVVIAPWNFPLAILTGMTTAALVTGNTAILKPAEQSPVIAAILFEILEQAGLPPGVANLLQGMGDDVGARLVEHPEVAVIAFTGSREIGLAIQQTAVRVLPGQRHLKRTILEMGGKNAIIIDDDADLDAAVKGVTASAFSYAGQKCSACSRAIVLDAVYEPFLERLVEATRSLPIGDPADPATVIGPLIDSEARDRVEGYITLGRQEATPALATRTETTEGFFVGPTIFREAAPGARIAQEEIFGPVLCVIRAADFDEALRIANDTDYGLTGGLYSRNPARIEKARLQFHVGNLYINRPITGALVDRQPFGGSKLSGVGSKAGGPDYLLQFCEPRAITENTIRHGFAEIEKP